VNYITDQVVNHVMDWIKNSKKKEVKSAGVKNFHVKNHLWIFVNALIDNPAFDSQTKETLTTRQAQFGSTCQLTEKLLKSGGYRFSTVCGAERSAQLLQGGSEFQVQWDQVQGTTSPVQSFEKYDVNCLLP
jgi:hypothetical protein